MFAARATTRARFKRSHKEQIDNLHYIADRYTNRAASRGYREALRMINPKETAVGKMNIKWFKGCRVAKAAKLIDGHGERSAKSNCIHCKD